MIRFPDVDADDMLIVYTGRRAVDKDVDVQLFHAEEVGECGCQVDGSRWGNNLNVSLLQKHG